MSDLPPLPIVAQEIRIVDGAGNTRMLLSAKGAAPVIEMRRADGKVTATIALDPAGRPAILLANPDGAGPMAALEVDDKGAHVKFDRPGGASSYLFLNNAGASGVVLIDPKGIRRLSATVSADGAAQVERFGADGKPLP